MLFISKHGRWWTISTTCTSTIPSCTNCPICTTSCTSCTTDGTSCTTYPPQPIQSAFMPHLNWSHFNLECAGKPDEDVEAHLLKTNNWRDTHAFPEAVKVQYFCLTIVGEARLWHESLRPINVDLNGLQN